MDFAPHLHYRLQSLSAALGRTLVPALRPRWMPRRRRRLLALRQHRLALMRWRGLRDALQDAGVPPLPARLGVLDGPPSFLWNGATGARIWLPVREACVPSLGTRSADTVYAQAVLLLHEWGHALLHPQADHGWLMALSGPARDHAHPAWAHIGEYAGWRVFNEMFADAFAAAWMLRLFHRSVGVLETLRALRRVRQHTARHFDHVDFPCHHQTSRVLGWVMRLEWDGPVHEIMPRLVRICSQAFEEWYDDAVIPGRDVCASSRAHILMLDREFAGSRHAVWLRGRSWRALGQPSNPHSRQLLALLRRECPDHFLWDLRAVSGVMEVSSSPLPVDSR